MTFDHSTILGHVAEHAENKLHYVIKDWFMWCVQSIEWNHKHRTHGEGYAYSFNSPCLPSFMSHASYGYYYYSKYALH